MEYYAKLKAKLKGDHEKIRVAIQSWYKSLKVGDSRKSHKHYNWSDDRGLYFAADFAGPDDGRTSRPRHDIFHPISGLPCKKPSTGWRWDEKKTKWALEQNPMRIHFGPDENTIPNRKSYLAETSFEPYPSVFYRDGRSATLEVESLVGKGIFPFPKNTDILQELIELTTKDGDLILDFFAGSASIGHAIFKTNLTSGENRKFILVQIPEEVKKKKFTTVAEVSKERLRNVGKRIKDENIGNELAAKLDIGFRVLKVDSSNMADVYYNPDALEQNLLTALAENIKTDRTGEDLLFQVMLDWGLDLSLPIRREQIEGKEVFFVQENALIACFEKGVSGSAISAIIAHRPLRVVFRDAGFADDAAKINVEQLFFQLSHETEVRVI